MSVKDSFDVFRYAFHNTTMLTYSEQPPFYYIDRTELIQGISDKILSIAVPFVVYWAISIPFDVLDYFSPACLQKYRIHESAEVQAKNRVSKSGVIFTVLLQQFIQTALGWWWLTEDNDTVVNHAQNIAGIQVFCSRMLAQIIGTKSAIHLVTLGGPRFAVWLYWWGIPAIQFSWAFFIMDTWQYGLHRLMHVVPFLYKHLHSWHHRLYVPYAYGALYNHPIEGLMLDIIGALLSFELSQMSPRMGILLFGVSTAKTVHDHCGWSLPFDPMQFMFRNNADYHDIHHQRIGIKSNFSQPFFVHWDEWLGTGMTRQQMQVKRDANRAKVAAT